MKNFKLQFCLIGILTLNLLLSCSSRTPAFPSEAYKNNRYFTNWETLASSQKKDQATLNRVYLFQNSFDVFKSQIQSSKRPHAILEPLREMKVPVGFLTTENMETLNFESQGQIWPFLVQIETWAHLICLDKGFRNWISGNCFDAYVDALALEKASIDMTITGREPLNENDVVVFQKNICSQLALKTAANLAPSERKTLYLAYKQNLIIRGRVIGLAKQQVDLIDQAFRMILTQ